MFDMTKPCVSCPFRVSQAKKYGLHPERLVGLFEGPSFQCHNTVRELGGKSDPQQCAGLMALLHAVNKPNQIMQIALRLTNFDPANISTDDTFSSLQECIAAHK